MRVAVFDARSYDQRFLSIAAEASAISFDFFEARLRLDTVPLATGYQAVCVFVNDQLDADVLAALSQLGCHGIALRCAGFNNVDVDAAHAHGLPVLRVPAYSPAAVAEHAVGLMLTLNRHIHRAYNRVREGNFELEGLLGFDLAGRTIGLVGCGQIGACVARIMLGFGSRVLISDPKPDQALATAGAQFVSFQQLLAESDIISLHCPLTSNTHHMIDQNSIADMRDGVMLVNTSRGALIDTAAVVRGLKAGKIGHLALDVYEEEAGLFFNDHSQELIQDDLFARLITFPNVLITGHQAFFTSDALSNIAATTVANLEALAAGGELPSASLVQAS